VVVSLDEQLAELDRELGMRRKLYPRWIVAGTLKRDRADAQLAALEAARETVRQARQREAMTGMNGEPMR
jgi:hypothetical protein